MTLISIVIPTYNGGERITKTLDCLIEQIHNSEKSLEEYIDIIIRDDNSTDLTPHILNKYSNKFNFIQVHQSSRNEGMDVNFRKVAMLASSEYIWYFGQDDLMIPNTITKVIQLIEQRHPNILFLNYSQINEDGKILNKSVMHEFYNGKLPENEGMIFSSSYEYFKFMNSPPTFLPAIIMKRGFWDNFDYKAYAGTSYVQAACVISNMYLGRILVYTKPLIIGLIPNDRWQSNGNSYVSVMIGYQKMLHLVSISKNSPIPHCIYRKMVIKFLLRLYFLFGHGREIGYSNNPVDLDNLYGIFSGNMYRRYIHMIYNLDWDSQKIIYRKINLIKSSVKLISKHVQNVIR